MRSSLANIKDLSVINLFATPIDVQSIGRVEYKSVNRNSGGFGNIHDVISINGITIQGLLLKIPRETDKAEHALESITLLHKKLRSRFSDVQYVCSSLPQLKGLPFAIFRCYNQEIDQDVIAMLMLDLTVLGFEDFGSDYFNKQQFLNLDITARLYYAYEFTKAISVLHEMKFIHSDLSENSIWINAQSENLVLIDFDSGYHIDQQEKPTTLGKIGQWIGTKFRNVLADPQKKHELSHEDRINEENWVVANAVFELLFAVSPYFFLVDATDKTKSQYLKKSNWPYTYDDDPTFNRVNSKSYELVVQQIEGMKQQGLDFLISAFVKVFNKGFSSDNHRITSSRWMELLFSICDELALRPSIAKFTSSKREVYSSDESVHFEWQILRGNLTTIDSRILLSSETELMFNDTTHVLLRAENDFGIVTEEILVSAMKKQPVILTFTSSELIRTSLEPLVLSWDTKFANSVIIDQVEGVHDKTGNLEVYPEKNTSYVLKAIGSFGETAEALITLDVIKPNIDSFYYEINIEKGIDNIDLYWKSKDGVSAEIIPAIGKVELNGNLSRSIAEKTTFKLIVRGLFSESSIEIDAKPFPIPLIETVFIPTPDFKIETLYLESSKLELNFVELSPIDLNLNVNLSEMDASLVKIDSDLGRKLDNPPKLNFFEDLFRNVFRID